MYNFEKHNLEEVVFFEYLVIKGQAFKFKPFFYSNRRITEETGIRKAALATIIKKFQGYGIIDVEVKGFPLVQYFTVNYREILKKLPDFYQLSENGKLLSDNGKLLSEFYQPLSENSQEKKLNKELNNKPKKNSIVIDGEGFAIKNSFSVSELQAAKDVVNSLDPIFNTRREMVNKKKRVEEQREFAATVLPKGKQVIYHCAKALVYKSELEIVNSFTVFADHFLTGELDHVRNILAYFFSQKENEEFEVIDYYLTYFNRNYAKSVK